LAVLLHEKENEKIQTEAWTQHYDQIILGQKMINVVFTFTAETNTEK